MIFSLGMLLTVASMCTPCQSNKAITSIITIALNVLNFETLVFYNDNITLLLSLPHDKIEILSLSLPLIRR
ncbi:hypothetical protein ACP0HM_05090 [Escherichia coli]